MTEETNEGGRTTRLLCGGCGHEIALSGGLLSLHPVLPTATGSGIDETLNEYYSKNEEKHFWFATRRDFIKTVCDMYIKHTDKIIEIGAATGYITRHLISEGYKNISIGDINSDSFKYSGDEGIINRYQFDLTRAPFVGHFDAVFMFDVLEHIDDAELSVKKACEMLTPQGRIVITVPAHMWLWSKHDTLVSHKKRYELDQVVQLLRRNGFKILKATAFFASILPLLYLRKYVDRDTGHVSKSDVAYRFRVNPIVNRLLDKILHVECKLLDGISLKYGGSLIVVGEKLK
ncbi:MAG: methyltransferase domain-containing protein [Nitrospirae bacterium]|nr:methyltransferase domain-containing protein [Nitrospirota bacterium]